MRLALAVAGLCVSIFGTIYVLMGRTPSDEVAAAPPKRGAVLAARSPQIKPAVTPKPKRAAQLPRFVGRYFSIQYPTGWKVDTAEASTGAYFDTTIRHPEDRSTYLRVDVTPKTGADPAVHAAEVEGYLRGQEGYERLGLKRAKLARKPAVRWDFGVVEAGVRLRKVDVFLTDGGRNRIAVLTQAPHSDFGRYEQLFERLRASLVPRV
jgi:hypothetical protein